MDGYLELPDGVTDRAREEIVRAFRDWAASGRKDTLVLMHGARYVPWSAWQPQAVVTPPPDTTVSQTIRWLAVSAVCNGLAVLILGIAVLVR